MRLIDSSLVALSCQAESDTEILDMLASRLEAGERVHQSFGSALTARERQFPTGLPVSGGVAIPHTDPNHVIHDSIAIATLSRPVPFREMAGGGVLDVSLVVVLALGDADSHLGLLQRVLKAVQDRDFVDSLRTADDPRAVAVQIETRFGA